MPGLNNTLKTNKVVKAIGIAWLVAGTLDILSAFLYFYIKRGTDPLNVLNYISKTVLGNSSGGAVILDDEIATRLFGLAFHFFIAFCWTLFFYILLPRLRFLRRNKIVAGLAYGIFIWIMMNLIFVPLYRGVSFKFGNTEGMIIGIVTLMLAVGLPISIILNNSFRRRS